MMVKSFYFAHPVTMYDTPVERGIADAFRKRFPDCQVENGLAPSPYQDLERFRSGLVDVTA